MVEEGVFEQQMGHAAEHSHASAGTPRWSTRPSSTTASAWPASSACTHPQAQQTLSYQRYALQYNDILEAGRMRLKALPCALTSSCLACLKPMNMPHRLAAGSPILTHSKFVKEGSLW